MTNSDYRLRKFNYTAWQSYGKRMDVSFWSWFNQSLEECSLLQTGSGLSLILWNKVGRWYIIIYLPHWVYHAASNFYLFGSICVLSKPLTRIGQLEMLTTIENSNCSTNKIHTAKQIEILYFVCVTLTFFHSLWDFSHNTHTCGMCISTPKWWGEKTKTIHILMLKSYLSSMPLKLSIEIDIPWRLFMIYWINAEKPKKNMVYAKTWLFIIMTKFL